MKSFFTVILAFSLAFQPVFALEVGAWVPSWDATRVKTSVESFAKFWDIASPFWYATQPDGTIKPNFGSKTNKNILIEETAKTNAPILPSVTNNFDGKRISGILRDRKLQALHKKEILAIVDEWDGVDLDYEALLTVDKDLWTGFVCDLARSVHSRGKLLHISVQPKSADSQNWNGVGATDVAALAECVDGIRIMAYDRHWIGSEAGAVAPIKWVEKTLAYFVRKAPADKIWLGVPFYGYDWIKNTKDGSSMTFDRAKGALEKYGITEKWDDEAASPFFEYFSDVDEKNHVVWFEDGRSLAAKRKLAEKYGIRGIFAWRVGGEGLDFWEIIGGKENVSIKKENNPDGDRSFAQKDSKQQKVQILENFADVGGDLRALLNALVSRGILTAKNEFRGSDGVTRAEFLKIALESSDIFYETGGESKFADVPSHSWFRKYVKFAENKEIVRGEDGNFLPHRGVTWAEGVKIMLATRGVDVGALEWPVGVLASARLREWINVFVPADEKMSREDVARLVGRVLGL